MGTVVGSESKKVLLLKDGELKFDALEDPAADKDALWRIESTEEEFDVLEFFYPSMVTCTWESLGPDPAAAGGAKQLRAGDTPVGQSPALTGDYDLADEKGHWEFIPVVELE